MLCYCRFTYLIRQTVNALYDIIFFVVTALPDIRCNLVTHCKCKAMEKV